MINKKFIFSDLDGTLLTDNKDIPENNIEAIKEFQKQGGVFSIATGRCLNSIKQNVKGITFNGPAILFNGCVIYDFINDTILWKKSLNQSISKKIIDFVLQNEKYNKTGVLIYTIDGLYSLRDNESVKKLLKIEGGGYSEKEKFTINSPWIKILFTDENEIINELNNDLHAFFNLNDIDTCFSLNVFLEILPKGINKGYSLNKIKQKDKYKEFTFYAVGDYYNDLEMLECADISVSPNNAPPEIQNVCKKVLCNNNDGVIFDLVDKIKKEEL